MNTANLRKTVFEAINRLPVIDVHTHLVGGHLGARGLHDLLLYHMGVSDLYAAGTPNGARLSQYPAWPDDAECAARIQEAVPFLDKVFNTSTSWLLRILLNDLYGWTERIDASNWRRLDAIVRERAHDRTWHRETMTRAGIVRFGTEIARREKGLDDDILHYALEWAFFTRCQWGEFDTALYELEKTWGRSPSSPSPIGSGGRAATDRQIRSIDDVHAAIEHYVNAMPVDAILSTATHISTDLDLRPVTQDEMVQALRKRAMAGPTERDTYSSYINEAYLTAFERHADRLIFQFSFGAEPLPFETGSRLSQKSIAQLGEMIARHPRVHFQCFLASAHANQSLCTLVRELPNLSLCGYWWHNFFPSIIKRVIDERMDMLPWNKQVGFFSDAYVIEWAYAKLHLVRLILAEVLAERISLGQYNIDDAVAFAQRVLYETPLQLNKMAPAVTIPAPH